MFRKYLHIFFQQNFVRSGGVSIGLDMLRRNQFLSTADLSVRRSAYYMVLRLLKLLLTGVGYAQIQKVAEALKVDPTSNTVSTTVHNNALLLQGALVFIPNSNSEHMTRSVAQKIGAKMIEKVF